MEARRSAAEPDPEADVLATGEPFRSICKMSNFEQSRHSDDSTFYGGLNMAVSEEKGIAFGGGLASAGLTTLDPHACPILALGPRTATALNRRHCSMA